MVLAVLVFAAFALPSQAAPGPFHLDGSASCSGFVPAIYLSWTPSAGATSYDVVREDGQHTTVTLATSTSDTNVTVGGPAHTYYVRASDGAGTMDSDTVSVAPPPTQCSPPPAPFTITGQAICYPGNPTHAMGPGEQLDWHSALYATSYQIFKNGAEYHLPIASGGDLYTFIGFPITDGVTNSYYVVAKNAAGLTTSNTVTLTIPADICVTSPPVAVLSATTQCSAQTHLPVVSLRWTSVPAAFGWQLYRDGAPYVKPQFFGYTDTNVVAGHTYTYNVATDGLGAILSNAVSVAVSDAVCLPGAVSVTATAFCNGTAPVVRLIWNAADNGATYTVLRGGATIADRLQGTSYDDPSPASGATYTYQIVATNRAGSTPSLPVTVTVGDQLCPPASFSSSAVTVCSGATPSVLLTWSKSARAVAYEIFRNGASISVPLPSSAFDYVDAAPLGFYSYAIRATNAAGSAEATTNGFATVAACTSAPGTFTAAVNPICRNGQQAVRVQWQAATGATSFAVIRNGVTLSTLAAPANTYEDNVVSVGQLYTYRVIASNGTGSSTAFAGSITPSTADCPPGTITLGATLGCTPPVMLSWTAPLNQVSSYTIFRNQNSIATVGASTFTYAEDSGLSSGSYSYVVRASGPGGVSDSNRFDVTFDRAACAGASPNLAAVDITPSVVTGHPGDVITIAVELANMGTVDAKPATARIRFGRGPAMSSSDPELLQIPLPAIAAGAHMSRTVDIRLPSLAAGTYSLFLSLDEEHVSGDARPEDNVKPSVAFHLIDRIAPRRRAGPH